MKLETSTDIENIAKAIEDDAGHSIDSLREALAEVRDGDIGRVSSREQLTVRAARYNAGVSQSVFAKRSKSIHHLEHCRNGSKADQFRLALL